MAQILITGANRGIGLALARLYKKRGDDVIAVCRKASPELKDLGVRVEEGVDVTSESDLKSLSRRLEGVTLDVLLNNAGMLARDEFETLDFQAILKSVDVNAVGPLRVTRILEKHLGPGAKVALVTSLMGSMSDNESGGYYAYRMSKAALNAAGVSLARDLRRREVSVALLHPGFVKTDMTGGQGHLTPDASAEGIAHRIDELDLNRSGGFWHADGRSLPW